MTDEPVKIFVSSPADVDHERAAVKDIIDRLAGEYVAYFPLRAVLWEEEALTADRTFQAGLTRPQDCDIVLVILWTRLGSPLPQEPYRGMTGTEWEFINAVETPAEGRAPEVLVYKKTTPKLVDITDASAAREAVEDRRRLEEFFRSNFFHEDNTFRRAFRTFDSAAAFRELVETQLRKLLNRRISAERRAVAGAFHWKGSPFRPDRPFEVSDERIFTGREQEVRDLLHRLDAIGRADAGLLLLTGPSGSGKTSLLRAGLVARITRSFQFEHIAAIRACLVDPTASAAGPLAAIATALCDRSALGEPLSTFGLDSDALTRLLGTDPTLAAQQISSAVRASAPEASTHASVRLLLCVDPLEPVLHDADDETLQRLGSALLALAAARAIWLLGVLRSDALPALGRLAALRPLIERDGWTEIGPPSVSRLRQVIEIPSRIAGIELDPETGSERGLVEHLEADASRIRLWPPLVQPVLDSAYQSASRRNGADDGELRLTGADLFAGGRIAEHVLRRADALWESLDGDAKAALPRLCRALITLESGPDGPPNSRYGSLVVLRRDRACRSLLDQLIATRLVIAEGLRDSTLSIHCEPPDYRLLSELRGVLRQTRDDWRLRLRHLGLHGRAARLAAPRQHQDNPAGRTGDAAALAPEPSASAAAVRGAEQPDWREYRAVASIVHPVLLSGWQPVRDWLEDPDNRLQLARRFQLGRQAQLWKRTNCNPEYLMSDAGYAEAEALVDAHRDELEPLEQDFIGQSKAHLALRRRRIRLVRGVGIVLAALMLLSAISAGLAYRLYADAQANLSSSRLNEADVALYQGNTAKAVNLALRAGTALPQRAVQTLGFAFSSNRLIGMASAPNPSPDEPRIPAFNADGSQLASFLPGRGPTRLELKHGGFEATEALTASELGLHTLVFGAGNQAFGIGSEGVWVLPATKDAPPDYRCGTPPGLSFSLDGTRQRLALSRDNGDGQLGLCVLDLSEPGHVILDKTLADGTIRSLSFSPDGTTLLTASDQGRARLIDIASGTVTRSLPADGPTGRPFDRAIFDARGERIAIASADERVRLFARDGAPIAELSSARIAGHDYQMHRSAVRDVAFDPGGAFLVAADDQGQIVRWTINNDKERAAVFDQAVVLNTHRQSANTVRVIEPPAATDLGESLVLSASLDGTAKLVGLQTGKSIAVLGHDAAIAAADFHAEGARIATLSILDQTVRLWSVMPTSSLAYTLRHPNHVWYVDTALAPPAIARGTDTLLLATAGYDGGVRVWEYSRDDSGTGPEPWVEFLDDGPQEPVRQVRFSPSGRQLASAHYDGTARVHDLIQKRTECVLTASTSDRGQVYNALFGPNGEWLLTTSDDAAIPVRAFSAQTCERIDTGDALIHDTGSVEAAAVESIGDASLIATGDESGIVRIIERAGNGQWQRRCSARLDIGAIGDITLSPNGRQLGVAGEASRALLIQLEQPSSAKGAPASAPEGLAAEGCGPLTALDGHAGRVYSIAFSPDAQQVVTASLDKTARVWRRGGPAVAILKGHKDRIYRAEFSPNGRWILTGSRDRSIRIWKRPADDADKVQMLSTFLPLEADSGGVANAVFSPDGHYVAGAYWENAAILWRLWAEDSELLQGTSADWGADRSELALVREAYRFRADNRIDEPEREPTYEDE
jgi:WD40 repeat protein